jgi:hypothetical protein
MDWKQIILILSTLIITIVFYLQHGRMPSKFRRETMNAPSVTNKRDGFTATIENMEDFDPVCDNPYSDPKNLPLREYYIKSCFNSAYDGNDVSCSSIVARIEEGYRFIDLNVFPSEGKLYVGFSHGNTPNMDSGSLLFTDALQCIANNAFIPPTTPSAGAASWDYTTSPIIVHIRVFRKPDSTIDVIAEVAKIINPNSPEVPQPSYSAKYHVKDKMPIKVDSCTPLSEISGKMLFAVNAQNMIEVYTKPGNFEDQILPGTKNAVSLFANMVTGTRSFPAFYRYTDVLTTGRENTLMKNSNDLNSYHTNVRYMLLALPHPQDDRVQPNIQKFALNTSILVLPMRVYLGDGVGENLALNNHIFKYNSTSFVPASKLQMSIETYVPLNPREFYGQSDNSIKDKTADIPSPPKPSDSTVNAILIGSGVALGIFAFTFLVISMASTGADKQSQ